MDFFTRMRVYYSRVGMEFPIFIYMFTAYLKSPIFQSLIYEKLCLEKYDKDYVFCGNVSAYHSDRGIQTSANHFYSLSSYILVGPAIFSTVVLGAACDYWSVKIAILVPYFGLVLGTFNYIIQTVYLDMDIHYLLISDAIFGICGGYISIISTTLCYGVKATEHTSGRSVRIAGMEGAIGLGGTVGFALSGTIRGAFGYAYTFLFMLALQVIAFIFILIVAKDKPKEEELPEDSQSVGKLKRAAYLVMKVFMDLIHLLLRPRPYRGIIIACLLALGVELFIFAGLSDIQYSYFRYKLQWGDKEFGWFNGLSFGLTTATVLVVYPFLRLRYCSDGVLGCLGIITKIISLFMLAFVSDNAMAYSVAGITMFNRFVSAGFRAFLSSLILSDEQGKMFSLIALLEGVTSLMSTAVYNNLYPKTLSFFAGTCYIASAILLIIPFFVLSYSDFFVKKSSVPETLIEEESDNENHS